jgi:hypothetical protein
VKPKAHAEAEGIQRSQGQQALKIAANLVLDPVKEIKRLFKKGVRDRLHEEALEARTIEQEEVCDVRHQ